MTKHRALGRGLSELIPAAQEPQPGEAIVELAIAQIDPNPYQPRREFDPQDAGGTGGQHPRPGPDPARDRAPRRGRALPAGGR